MIFTKLIILSIYISLCYSSKQRSINCYIGNKKNEDESFLKISLNISFERSETAVYKYENLSLVNILIEDVRLTIKGTLREPSDDQTSDIAGSVTTKILGSCNLKDEKFLHNCDFEMETNSQQDNTLSASLQNKIFYSAEPCLNSLLSDEIGEVDAEDFRRGDVWPYDFGEQAAPYKSMLHKFPNLYRRPKTSNRTEKTLQETVNSISDTVIATAVKFVSGKKLGVVDIPDQKQPISDPGEIEKKYWELKGGKFSGFQNIRRLGDIYIGNSGLHFSVRFEVEIPNTQIHFDSLKIKYSIADVNKNITIDIDSIIFGLQIDLNYNQNSCQPSIDRLKTEISGITPNFECCGVLNYVAKGAVNKLLKKVTPNIVGFVKVKINEFIREFLKDFDCEISKPRLRKISAELLS